MAEPKKKHHEDECESPTCKHIPKKLTLEELCRWWVSPDMRAGDEMAARLRKMDALHQPFPSDELGRICDYDAKEWPCPERRILDGEE